MTRAPTVADLWRQWGSPRRAVAVTAHPDDESFGLGAVLSALADSGTRVSVVCFTRGEASTLGSTTDLGSRRHDELLCAASILGVRDVAAFELPDGHLEEVDDAVLESLVQEHIQDAELVVAFEPGGVTGHPDHRAATGVAERVAGRLRIPMLEWGVSPAVASALQRELGVRFTSLESDETVVDVEVDRTRQRRAIACHGSQAADNPVLARRLSLQGPTERLRFRDERLW